MFSFFVHFVQFTPQIMAFQFHSTFLFFIFFLFFLNFFIFCQSDSPQNIETFYPSAPPPSFPPSGLPTPTASSAPPPRQETPPKHSLSRKAIATAVGVTAASTFVAAALLFFVWTKYAGHRKKDGGGRGGGGAVNPYAAAAVAATGGGGAGRLRPVETEFTRFDGNIKGLIVDEDGLDVLYWRKLEGNQRKSGNFRKEVFNNNKPPSGKRNIPRGKSSSSSSAANNQVHPKDDQRVKLLDSKLPSSSDRIRFDAAANPGHRGSENLAAVASPLPPPLPPPTGAVKKAPPPPPPPIPAKKGPAAPPPPPKGGSASASSRPPPPAQKRSPSGNVTEMNALGRDGGTDEKIDQVKMKPLHWEKVNVVNRDHSMVWDKLDRGSFQYNGDMMEALFGTVAANRKSPKDGNSNQTAPNPAAKIFILDSRRSQNIAIIIRSLGISRRELVDGLSEGKGLNLEILEKLTRMAPTKDEKTQILAFDGQVERLADAESFLYHLLKALPSAFTRVNALLFRHTYGSEIQQLKETLQTIDAACTELRNRGVFLKLLEAILKAGNRLNAGTMRGDAKAFNLTALRKLSDYKSSDGKTTLLHFVVHEVVRNEGRRCVMNRNNSLNRSNSQKNAILTKNPSESDSKEEQEREFLKLGLPVVGGLSSEFSNVKKAATFDYDTLSSNMTSLVARIAETRQLVLQCGADGTEGEFIKEMKEFLEASEVEINDVKDEETRVMEFVKKTTRYYQSGSFKEKQPLQLFALVKDFLDMVDKACIDITRSLQQKKGNPTAGAGAGSSASPSSPTSPSTPDILRTRVTFPRLPDHFLSEKSSGSDSDDDQ
ncbi:hypothetical protein RND81_07G188100 [Saponaria officinalis]|uniref:Formin-like protein n=1 Tax=Saponaria officinalis TaxID=3572 RepID=A0AAW1JTM1_SAPOF